MIRRFLITAALISAPMAAVSPAEAFWWQEKEPTYDMLLDNDYRISIDMERKIYNSDGWMLMKMYDNGRVDKMKLIDCRGSRCMYYWRVSDEKGWDQDVYVNEINCVTKEERSKPQWAEPWTPWLGIFMERTKVAYIKFCP